MALNEAAARLGVSLRQTEDTLTRDMLAATASVYDCRFGGGGDTPTFISENDGSSVTRLLLSADAYTVADNIEAEDKIGTGPVRDAFIAMGHTNITKDLDSIDKFLQKNAYPSPMNALRSEWGSLNNLRFLVSSIGSISPNSSAAGNDVYNVFVTGLEGYACIEQDGYSAAFIYRPPIYQGPLALNCTVGYKFAEVPRITNDEWVINMRMTIS